MKNVPATDITVLLMPDAVVAAPKGQKTPDGYYNMERMLRRVVVGNGKVLLGTCMDARRMVDADLMDGALRSTMDELAGFTMVADKVMIF